ncbi:MAG TPA: aminotransferase class IV [Bacteroidales bacterium]|nr:aminotransferase class IV [Bacteroidales bacterium]
MEQCLLNWFVHSGELRRSSDFHQELFLSDVAVYEVLRIVDGKPLFFDDHLKRLIHSMKLAGLGAVSDTKFLCEAVRLLIEANQADTGNIKMHIGRRHPNASPVLTTWLIPYAYPTADMYAKGVKVSLFRYERPQPNAKIVNNKLKQSYAEQMEKDGAYELLLHHNGFITEGSRSNVFFIVDGVLHTAPDEMVLKGITRHKILEIIAKEHIPIVFEPLEIKMLNKVQGAFICGTSPKVLPVSSIDDTFHFSPHNDLINIIIMHYDRCIQHDIASFSWKSC